MAHLPQLMEKAKAYANAYAVKYEITSEEVIQALYLQHLAYLIRGAEDR